MRDANLIDDVRSAASADDAPEERATVVVEMRYEPGNEHEVERPLAGHLIRDVDLTAPRVADRRFHAGDSCLLSPDSQQPGDGASAESPRGQASGMFGALGPW
jgi:hypothetical protein